MANMTPNSNLQCAVEVNYSEDPEQQFVMAFLDLYGDGKITTEKLSDFAHSYYVNNLKTREFCEAVVEEHGKVIVVEFCHHIARVSRQQFMMGETLQSFNNSSDENLDRINAWKNFSFVFFTIAAAVTAAVAAVNACHKRPAVAAAAAAASIVLSALGNWAHSLMKKHESTVKKHKEIISIMIMGTQFAIKDLIKIHEVARRLQSLTEFMSEIVGDEVDVRKKLTAFKTSIEELVREDDHYRQDMSLARNLVLQSIIKHLD